MGNKNADYVAHLRKQKGDGAADDADGRLGKQVTPKLGKVRLNDLRSRKLKDWLAGLVPEDADEIEQRRALSSANRPFNSFKAALNLAFNEGFMPSDGDLRRVKGFDSADSTRELFLTQQQVRKLLDATIRPFHDLLQAAVLTGARDGELAVMDCRHVVDYQFEPAPPRSAGTRAPGPPRG